MQSDDNPLQEIQQHNVLEVTFWAGVCHKGTVGPYFFDGTVLTASVNSDTELE
jgi:hypothetical protein